LFFRYIKTITDSKKEPVKQANLILSQIAAKPAEILPGIHWLPELSFLRVNLPDGHYQVYSLIRNRRHSNVAFMLGESLRYQKDLDSLTILPELTGSYPNLIFQVNLAELEPFVQQLSIVNSDSDFNKIVELWGVRRMSPDFWKIFHSFSQYMQNNNPLEAGIYDMNRYGHW